MSYYINDFKKKRYRYIKSSSLLVEFNKIEAAFDLVEADIKDRIRLTPVLPFDNSIGELPDLNVAATRANRVLAQTGRLIDYSGTAFVDVQKPSARLAAASSTIDGTSPYSNNDWGPWRRADGLTDGVFSRPFPFIYAVGTGWDGSGYLQMAELTQGGKKFSTVDDAGNPFFTVNGTEIQVNFNVGVVAVFWNITTGTAAPDIGSIDVRDSVPKVAVADTHQFPNISAFGFYEQSVGSPVKFRANSSPAISSAAANPMVSVLCVKVA